MSNKKDKYKINYSTYVSGGRAVGKSGSYKKESTGINGAISGMLSSMSGVGKNISKSSSSKNSSSTGIKGAISSAGSSISRFANGDGSRNSSEGNINLDYNVKKYMGQRGGTFGDKSYTKIGDDFYLKANPYSGIDMKKNNKPKLLKENQYNVSEENREKINKGKIESYIKGINPYSAPPKNIRDAKAKESVESLMNSIQKRKNNVFKNQSEDNERGITDQGISQVTSNIKPYGMDQRSAVNTKNNSLYQAYPGYGSRGTSVGYFRKNVEHKEKNMDNYVYEHNSIPGQPTSKDFTKKYLKVEPTTKNTTKVQKTANVGDFRQNVDSKSNKEKAYGYEHISIPGQPTSKDFTKKYLKVEPTTKNTTKVQKTVNVGDFRQNVDSKSNKEKAYGYEHNSIPGQPTSKDFTKKYLKVEPTKKNTTKVQKTAYVGEFRQNVDSKSNKEKAYGYEHISIPGQPTSRNFTQEHLKAKSKSKNTKLQNPVNTSDIMNYYYVPNGKFNKDEFNQQMTDYKSYLTEKENLKKQNKTKEAEELEKQNEANVNDLLYSNNSVPGQPTSGNFTQEHLGKAVPEYKDIETKENEAKEMEKECSEDPNRDMFIKKGESIESNNTNAGFMYDTNPMKAYEDDSWYLNRGIEKDTRYKKNYDYMTQEEKDTANYILGKYGAKAQAKYLENIAYRMELRERDEKYNNMKNLGPLQLMYYGFTNGMGEKWHDIVQGMSLAGGNENIIPDSGRSMAIEKKRSELTGVDKYLFDGPEWVGNNIITALASIFSPVVGIPLDATADYGSTYKKSMNGEYNIDEKGNTEIGEKNANNKMLISLLTNLLTLGTGSILDDIDPSNANSYEILKELFSDILNNNIKNNLAPKYRDK
ncbi:hypothetical protein [Anaerofustis sp. NSJ-163]|uniref:hypothetical protein n=1 Tax=Anaerofustis sp. NSJ-163 TaxID=2944391 RepID=UPI00209BC100|nr:hypothetical protein [Anaerofustis sp. NSJ-163]MCO8193014.1 hypothetical protein [Anaerofustis sp. NSJ-163]